MYSLLMALTLLGANGLPMVPLVNPLSLSVKENSFRAIHPENLDLGYRSPNECHPAATCFTRTLAESELTIPVAEYNALLDLFVGNGGLHWLWNPNISFGVPWNISGGDPCLDRWQGVTCFCVFPTMCFVVQLDLFGKHLIGRIPSSIQSFNFLVYLNLGANALTGSIPKEIGSLGSLEYLFLYVNRLTGPIPTEIFGLTKLLYLVLGQLIDFNDRPDLSDKFRTGISGTLSPRIRDLVRLQYLYIYNTVLTGLLPTSLSEMSQLKAVVIGASPLSGTIPSAIMELRSLKYLVIGPSNINGTIPPEVGQLSEIFALSFNINKLTGTIPSSLGTLSTLQLLYLSDNCLSGNIPTQIAGLKSLFYMELSRNRFSGNLPSGLGAISALSLIDVHRNRISGSIPTFFGVSTPALSFLNLAFNSFAGSLPSTLGQMYSLNYLNISGNCLKGTIPPSLGELPSIEFLSFQNNKLTGTVPSNLFKLRDLRLFDIVENRITGTFPGFICNNWKTIVSLSMAKNRFSGTIPSCIGQLNQSLFYFDLSLNDIGGTLPSAMGALYKLQHLKLDNNNLVGKIPSALGGMMALVHLRMSDNGLTGRISSSLCLLSNLVYLDLSANDMHGSIPDHCLSELRSIRYLFLQRNRFDGSLGKLFSNSTQMTKLQVIDISNNEFSNMLPKRLFEIAPSLTAFSAIRNCLYGRIPKEICFATSLVSLSLDGIGTAPACQSKYIPGLSAYGLAEAVDSGIPDCLFSLPHIELLHLSGNGIEDELPSSLNMSSSLSDLVLSHNQLRGDIPIEIQKKSWVNIDLSFNKFSGTLSENMSHVSSRSALFLNVNRLSGKVPVVLRTAKNISVLDGNLFSCAFYSDDNSLPKHDDNAAVYQCADTFQQLSFVWASPFFLSLLAIGLILLILQLKSGTVSKWVMDKFHLSQRWIGMLNKDVQLSTGRTNTVFLFLSFVRDFRRTSFLLTVYIVLVLAPTWLALNHFYSTYDYLYAWTISSAYLSGIIPAIVIFVMLLGMLILVFVLYSDNIKKDRNRKTSRFMGGIILEPKALKVKQYFILSVVILLNCSIVLAINLLYVYVVVTYNRVYATLAALGLAGFNLFWNNVITVRVLHYLGDILIKDKTDVPKVGRVMSVMTLSGDSAIAPVSNFKRKYEARSMVVQCLLELLNKIGIPCLATSAVSSACFRSVLIKPRIIRSIYYYSICSLAPEISYTCFVFENVDVCNAVDGVNYNCYGDNVVAKETSYDPPFAYSYQCSAIFISSYAATYVYMFIVVAFGIPSFQSMLLLLQRRFSSDSWCFKLINSLLPTALKEVTPDFHLPPHKHLFDKARFVVISVSYTAILVTFGAVFPPLAVVICFAIICKSHVAVLTLGRLLEKAEEKNIARYRNTLLEECQDVAKNVGHQVWLLVPFAALFYSFFIFDTLGDAEGYQYAVIPAGLMILIVPLTLFFAKRLHDIYMSTYRPRSDSNTSATSRSPRGRSATKAVINMSPTKKIAPAGVGTWMKEIDEGDLAGGSTVVEYSNRRLTKSAFLVGTSGEGSVTSISQEVTAPIEALEDFNNDGSSEDSDDEVVIRYTHNKSNNTRTAQDT